jgi:hypothetical protein
MVRAIWQTQLMLTKAYFPAHVAGTPGRDRRSDWRTAKADASCRRIDNDECIWKQQLEGETRCELEGRTDGNEAEAA